MNRLSVTPLPGAISSGTLSDGFNHYHLTKLIGYDDANDDSISITYWTLPWCRLLLYATVLWGCGFTAQEMRHRWLGNSPKVTQIEYDPSNVTSQLKLGFAIHRFPRFGESMAKNGSHVANQNHHVLSKLKTSINNFPGIFLESILALQLLESFIFLHSC